MLRPLRSSRNRQYILLLLVLITFHLMLSNSPSLKSLVTTVSVSVFITWMSIKIVDLIKFYLPPMSVVEPSNRAIVITGTSSGFGNDLAKKLDKLGFTVFAGVRNVTDPRAISLAKSCSKKLMLVKLDVTSDEDVKKAANFVRNNMKSKYLWAVVNNAGIFKLHGIDWGAEGIDDYKSMIDTNTLGSVRVTRAFLPMLKQIKNSRVIIVSSIASHITWPAMTGYGMSKYALRSFGSGLRREMKPFKVYVSMIEPDFYGTPLVDQKKNLKQLDQTWEETSDEVKDSYNGNMVTELRESAKTLLEITHEDPSPVVDAMVKCIMSSGEPDHTIKLSSYTEAACFSILQSLPSEQIDEWLTGTLLKLACTFIHVMNTLFGKVSYTADVLISIVFKPKRY